MKNQIIQGDCFEFMQSLPDNSIDMILCDLPYGTTACKWDTIIPFEPLWEQYKRIVKPNAAIVLTASQPFTSQLVMSNPKWFKYCWIWDKIKPSGHLSAKKRPMSQHEDILVFCESSTIYNPILKQGRPRNKKVYGFSECYGKQKCVDNWSNTEYPKSIISFSNANQNKFHPTQKPVTLFEYLIKTYTNEGELVLDNCAGSGTTAIACLETGRNYICVEQSEKYIQTIHKRVDQWHSENGYKLSLEERVQWLETQVQAQGHKIKKIEQDRQLNLFEGLWEQK